jgi:hypothetical protein
MRQRGRDREKQIRRSVDGWEVLELRRNGYSIGSTIASSTM